VVVTVVSVVVPVVPPVVADVPLVPVVPVALALVPPALPLALPLTEVPNILVLVVPLTVVPEVVLVPVVPLTELVVFVPLLLLLLLLLLLVPPNVTRRLAVNVPLQIRTFVRFVAAMEFVVTPLVSVIVADGLLATAFVSIPDAAFVSDVITFVSATEFVVENTLTPGVVMAGAPIVKTLLEVPDVVVVPKVVPSAVPSEFVVVATVFVFATPKPAAALLLAIRFARFVSVMPATLVAVTAVELLAVVLVEVVPDAVPVVAPVFPNSTAVNAAIIPFVVAAWLVPNGAFVPPSAMSPVNTNCTFPLKFPLLLLLLFDFCVIIAVPIEFVSSGTNINVNCCVCLESLAVATSWN